MCISQKESPKPAKTHKNAGKKQTTTTPQKHPPKANINETQQSTKKQPTTTPTNRHDNQPKNQSSITMTSKKPATTTKKTNNTLSSSQTTSHNQKHPKTRAHQPQRPTQHYTHLRKVANPQVNALFPRLHRGHLSSQRSLDNLCQYDIRHGLR